jgi:hypothetical protein
MTHARTKVRATIKIGSIHFLTVDLGKQLAPHQGHLFLKDHQPTAKFMAPLARRELSKYDA